MPQELCSAPGSIEIYPCRTPYKVNCNREEGHPGQHAVIAFWNLDYEDSATAVSSPKAGDVNRLLNLYVPLSQPEPTFEIDRFERYT